MIEEVGNGMRWWLFDLGISLLFIVTSTSMSPWFWSYQSLDAKPHHCSLRKWILWCLQREKWQVGLEYFDCVSLFWSYIQDLQLHIECWSWPFQVGSQKIMVGRLSLSILTYVHAYSGDSCFEAHICSTEISLRVYMELAKTRKQYSRNYHISMFVL